MPIIVCFEGQLTARPETTSPTGEPAETVTTAVVTVPPPPGSRASRKAATTYHLRAHGHRAQALARLVDGDTVVVIGHVETEAITAPDTSGRLLTSPTAPAPASSAGARRTYRDTVVVDSIGTSLAHPVS